MNQVVDVDSLLSVDGPRIKQAAKGTDDFTDGVGGADHVGQTFAELFNVRGGSFHQNKGRVAGRRDHSQLLAYFMSHCGGRRFYGHEPFNALLSENLTRDR